MKKNKRSINFINTIINLILLSIVILLIIFVYYCMNYGIETTLVEFAENLQITKIGTLDDTTQIELSNTQTPLYSTEVSNNYTQDILQNEKLKYYYMQIDENAKIIYNALESNKDNLKTGNYTIDLGNIFNNLLNKEGGSEVLNNSYQQALDAFSMDNPDVFYIDVSKMLLMIYSRRTIIKTTYTVSIKSEENDNYFGEEFNSKEEVENASQELENIKFNLCSQVTGDTYDKVKQVHDCLINSLEYDQTISKPNIRNIYGALGMREAVCEGYAKSFKYILDELGIQNIIVVGTATNSSGKTESHAWNYVYIDENWYAVDVTWDDPILIGGGKLPEKEKRRYFLKGSEYFNKNHNPTGKVSDNGITFIYPELYIDNY